MKKFLQKPLSKSIGIMLATALATGGISALSTANATGGAATISANNLGDMALIPYYTVRGNYITGVHITNTSGDTQVVKFRLRRATDSADALDINIILSPFDMWTGYLKGDGTDVMLVPTDNSCTAPQLESGKSFFTAPDVNKAGADEGYIEIIGMGQAVDETDTDAGFTLPEGALHKANGEPAKCVEVAKNFLIDNVVDNENTRTNATNTTAYDSTADVLKVQYFIRDGASGMEFGDNAVHFAEFSNKAMMTNQQAGLSANNYSGFDFPDLDGGGGNMSVAATNAATDAANAATDAINAATDIANTLAAATNAATDAINAATDAVTANNNANDNVTTANDNVTTATDAADAATAADDQAAIDDQAAQDAQALANASPTDTALALAAAIATNIAIDSAAAAALTDAAALTIIADAAAADLTTAIGIADGTAITVGTTSTTVTETALVVANETVADAAAAAAVVTTAATLAAVGSLRGLYNDEIRRLLGSRDILNDWSYAASTNAATDWVVTVPGQYLMVDPNLGNTARYTDLPLIADINIFNREEQQPTAGSLVVSPSKSPDTVDLSNEVNVIEWGGKSVFGSANPVSVSAGNDIGDKGWASLSLESRTINRRVFDLTLVPATGTTVSTSTVAVGAVPVLGFTAWQRTFTGSENRNYGRIVHHSRR